MTQMNMIHDWHFNLILNEGLFSVFQLSAKGMKIVLFVFILFW